VGQTVATRAGRERGWANEAAALGMPRCAERVPERWLQSTELERRATHSAK
jgi:hypothetical protein